MSYNIYSICDGKVVLHVALLGRLTGWLHRDECTAVDLEAATRRQQKVAESTLEMYKDTTLTLYHL